MIPKFRAWDKVLKKMTYSIIISKDWALAEVPIDIFNMFGNLEKRYKFMQSTELKDKNDKEIFEGDILKTRTRGLVSVRKESGNMMVTYQSGVNTRTSLTLSSFLDKYKVYVIGNIYENPELLEGEDE